MTEHLDRHGWPVFIDQLLVLDLEAGLLQQPQRLAQVVAHVFRHASDRIGEGVVKTSGGTLSRTVSRISSSSAFRQAARIEFGAVEEAVDAPVLPEESCLFISSKSNA
jgi:hypothetical protein